MKGVVRCGTVYVLLPVPVHEPFEQNRLEAIGWEATLSQLLLQGIKTHPLEHLHVHVDHHRRKSMSSGGSKPKTTSRLSDAFVTRSYQNAQLKVEEYTIRRKLLVYRRMMWMFMQASIALTLMAWSFEDEKFMLGMAWLGTISAVCITLYAQSVRVELGPHTIMQGIALSVLASFLCWRDGWVDGYGGVPNRSLYGFAIVKGLATAKLTELGLL